MAKDIEK